MVPPGLEGQDVIAGPALVQTSAASGREWRIQLKALDEETQGLRQYLEEHDRSAAGRISRSCNVPQRFELGAGDTDAKSQHFTKQSIPK